MGVNAGVVPNLIAGVGCSISIGANRGGDTCALGGGRVTSYALRFSRGVIMSRFSEREALNRLVLVSHIAGVASTYNIIEGAFISRSESRVKGISRRIHTKLGNRAPMMIRFPVNGRKVALSFTRRMRGKLAMLKGRACLCRPTTDRRCTRAIHRLGTTNLVMLLILSRGATGSRALGALSNFCTG